MINVKRSMIIQVILINLALLLPGHLGNLSAEIKDEGKTDSFSETDLYRWVNARAGLIMRKDHSRESGKVVIIPFGSKVHCSAVYGVVENINGQNGSWTRVEWNGYEGWVFGGYLADEEQVLLNPCLDDLRKKARERYSGKAEIAAYNGIDSTKLSDKIKVRQVLGPYAIVQYRLSILNGMGDDYNDAVWVYFNDCWSEYKTSFDEGFGATLLYLDNDNIPDLITNEGCCNHSYFMVMLGKPPVGFETVYYSPTSDAVYDVIVRGTGKCSDTFVDIYNNKNGKIYKYHFDCKERTMVPDDKNNVITEE